VETSESLALSQQRRRNLTDVAEKVGVAQGLGVRSTWGDYDVTGGSIYLFPGMPKSI